MARINLLPWRDDRRQIRKREFWTQMGVAAALSAVAVFAGMSFMDHQNEQQELRNSYLTQQIAELDKKIVEIKDLEKRKAKLLKKKEIIENLQGDRSLMVHIFEQLARTIPDGVALTALKQTADSILLDGKAQSEARVAQYMRNLDDSPYLKDTDLNTVELQDPTVAVPGQAARVTADVKTGSYRKGFVLKISIDRPKDMTLMPEDGQTTADPVVPADVAATPADSTANSVTPPDAVTAPMAADNTANSTPATTSTPAEAPPATPEKGSK
jgi:type IV pilus assembly protein PilN